LERKVADNAQKHFVTGISMITSVGQSGHNVMAAEWTMQISYDPFLIAVFIHHGSVTLKNIRKTKEFGVNVASESQSDLVSIAGGYSGSEIKKLEIKNSFTFLKSKFIRSRLIANCIINAECKLFSTKKLGDHVMVIGKVIAIRYNRRRKPLLYHSRRYYKMGSIIEPSRKIVKVNRETFDWFSNEAEGKFILKYNAAIIKSGKNVLLQMHSRERGIYETIPYLKPKRGTEYLFSLQEYLRKMRIKTRLKAKPIVKKLVLQNKKRMQRVNFVLFEGDLPKPLPQTLKNKNDDQLLKAICD
jgi:flavin reductase (DIM6/NTAB) family NADH-FMN oxidoreductase RutF